jgi:hypothetical protein
MVWSLLAKAATIGTGSVADARACRSSDESVSSATRDRDIRHPEGTGPDLPSSTSRP